MHHLSYMSCYQPATQRSIEAVRIRKGAIAVVDLLLNRDSCTVDVILVLDITASIKITHPSDMRMKSAVPCTITVRWLFSITFGRTVKTGWRLLSPFGNTLDVVHSSQVTLGA
jgi:hypothetical protein